MFSCFSIDEESTLKREQQKHDSIQNISGIASVSLKNYSSRKKNQSKTRKNNKLCPIATMTEKKMEKFPK